MPPTPSPLAGEGGDRGRAARPRHSPGLHHHPRPLPSQGEGKNGQAQVPKTTWPWLFPRALDTWCEA